MLPGSRGLFALVIAAMALSSCRKDPAPEYDRESQVMVDYAICDAAFMGIVPGLFRHFSATSSARADSDYGQACSALTFISGDTLFMQNVTYSLNASDLGCSLDNAAHRTGSLRVELNGGFTDDNSRVKIALINYSEGRWTFGADSIVVTRIGTGGRHVVFRCIVSGGFAEGGGNRFFYECDRVLSVFPSASASDNGPYCSIYGQCSGHSRHGISYTAEIIRDLIKPNNCIYFNRGIIQLQPKDYAAKKLDYGDGECEGAVSFTLGEKSYGFKLK